uniref:Uncharacterized protein n=1 Tax=virus sp. ctBM815 TaxID=2825806 RepID=A0A8S5RK70_9VIRU|nr:MAG TPA: hypothetical protein [virus sp. ctBM815]
MCIYFLSYSLIALILLILNVHLSSYLYNLIKYRILELIIFFMRVVEGYFLWLSYITKLILIDPIILIC